MAKLMIVDDHNIVREGLATIIERNSKKHQVAAMASNGKEAIEILKSNEIDLVLMDINMNTMNGIDCTKDIIKHFPEKKVLALTLRNDYKSIKEMLGAGASGFLLKNCEEQELIEAIDTVLNNNNYYSPQVSEVVLNVIKGAGDHNQNTSGEVTGLTKREKEVLQLILQEYSNKEIGEKLFISSRTVELYKRKLLDKTGSKNIAGLVLYAVRNKLL